MKNLVLKVPSLVFIALYVFPAVLKVMHYIKSDYSPYVWSIQYLVGMLWMMSVVDYVASELKGRKFVVYIYALLVLEMVLVVIPLFVAGLIDMDWLRSTIVFHMIFKITLAIILAKHIKKLFYARSFWFLFMECLVPFLGMFTLTQEVKNWEKEKEL